MPSFCPKTKFFPFPASRVRDALRAFARDESGQGVTEYVLLLGFVVLGAGVIARGILTALDAGVLKLGGQLEKDLKTGRAPLGNWQN